MCEGEAEERFVLDGAVGEAEAVGDGEGLRDVEGDLEAELEAVEAGVLVDDGVEDVALDGGAVVDELRRDARAARGLGAQHDARHEQRGVHEALQRGALGRVLLAVEHDAVQQHQPPARDDVLARAEPAHDVVRRVLHRAQRRRRRHALHRARRLPGHRRRPRKRHRYRHRTRLHKYVLSVCRRRGVMIRAAAVASTVASVLAISTAASISISTSIAAAISISKTAAIASSITT